MFQKVVEFFKGLVPSKKAKAEIEHLQLDTAKKEKECVTDALNGDTQAMRCLNALDETLSQQTMKALRGQGPKPAKS